MTIIVGAGMAGLLAGAMLRRECGAIFEAQPEIPNNHSAVLRFRSSIVGDTLGIPFRKVTAMKAVQPWRNPIADALSYSLKTNGTATVRSITSAHGLAVDRYIAPPDLIPRMAEMVEGHIMVGQTFDNWPGSRLGDLPVISTIPMDALMKKLGWSHRDKAVFRSVPGVNVSCELSDVDAYCSLYVPNPIKRASRISLTGNLLTVECYGNAPVKADQVVGSAMDLLGLPLDLLTGEARESEQKYAKILPIDEDVRRAFILWASQEHNIYSLGRFATWRPGLLLDDVVNDVRVIQKLIANGSAFYDHSKKV
jgi:hypothetical protein